MLVTKRALTVKKRPKPTAPYMNVRWYVSCIFVNPIDGIKSSSHMSLWTAFTEI